MFTASRPVMPWMMKVLSLVIRIDMGPSPLPFPGGRGTRGTHFGDGASGRLVHRDGAVAVVDAIVLQDLEALGFPRAGDAEDGDLLCRLETRLDHALDDAAGDDVDARVRDHVHHHRDLLHS